MTTIEAADDQPRRSTVIRRELNAARAALSDAAESHHAEDYSTALASMRALQGELDAALLREHAIESQARQNAAHEAAFAEKYGAPTAGEVLARRLTTDEGRIVSRVNEAQRLADLAQAALAPKPTTADLAAEALQRIVQQAEDIRKGASTETELEQATRANGEAA